MGAETLILSGFQLLGGLFGSGQVYGADFENRKTMVSNWMSVYGLSGANGKYIDQNVLQSLITEDPGHPSGYTRNNGLWQDDIQQYFAEISNVVNGKTGNSNEVRFYDLVNNYVMSINGNPNYNPGTGGNGQVNPPLPPKPIQSGTTSIIWIIIIVGLLLGLITGIIKI